ncbi:syntaxin-binding protein 1-like [Xenia sp. Carnegie-2017]|uniref:syntaxin-binding protein 1-like n=1 Tax=Xenia sp. Carnegie-2017 TaxID=2897299 RepID=UPI001F04323A|nr:syntaxin-binding protein 1-like [Xenia sp. Carnegie-2017]
MSLKEAVGRRIIDDVIKPLYDAKKWKVLILDKDSLKIVSSCCKMNEVMNEGITMVEGLEKKREPLPSLEAIYIISPTENSVDQLLSDFDKDAPTTMYMRAHVFFTKVCNDELFNKLANSSAAKFIKTLKEINMAFIPYESQVYSLNMEKVVNTFYMESQNHSSDIEKVAEQLATLCSTLGEYPSIRFRNMSWSQGLAQALQSTLTAYKADDPSMGEGSQKHRSQFLLLDRGFDPIAPLLHELTYQAMAYDLLNIKNDVYTYTAGDDEKSVVLDESNEIWNEFRHNHIAEVTNIISSKTKEFVTSCKLTKGGEKTDLRDLKQVLKKVPQYQKELSALNMHFLLAEECMKKFRETTQKICPVEQDMATGADHEGEKIKDPLKNINPLLLDSSVSVQDKIRIILLYIISKDGISEENLLKLCQHAQIPKDKQTIITNMAYIGVPLKEGNVKKKSKPERKERPQQKYQLSRYVPYVKDLMEDSLKEKLDEKMFNYIPVSRNSASGYGGVGQSARYGQWHKGQTNTKSCPRLIVFIMGGLTYSEMRAAYEVKKANQEWDVVIGSTHIIKPVDFLSMLHKLEEY